MDKIIELAKELKDELNSKEEFKTFYFNKRLLEESKELEDLRLQIASSSGEEHRKLLKQYNEHPLIVNYNNSKEEIADILRVIKGILE